MKEKVVVLVSEVLKIGVDEVNSNLDNKDLWDSLQRVEIIFAIEDEFMLHFETEELAEIDTPQKLIDYVLGRME